MRMKVLRHNLGLWLIGLGTMSLSACYSDLDYAKIKCGASDPCPGGYTCGGAGLCIPAGSGMDALAGADLATPLDAPAAIDAGVDEAIGIDTAPASDGSGIDSISQVDGTDTPLGNANDAIDVGIIDLQLSPTDGYAGIDALTTTITEFTITTSDSGPERIIRGPDDNLWFTERSANKIGKITVDGQITEYPAPADCTGPTAITAGPNGDIWYADTTGRLVRMTTTGSATVVTPDTLYDLTSIITGPDGQIWVGTSDNGVIGKVDPITQTMTSFRLERSPVHLVAGPDKAIWFTAGWYVGRVTTAGDATYYELPQRLGVLAGEITLGPDMNMWFVEEMAILGRITPQGQIKEFFDADLNHRPMTPDGIATGKDGNLWVVERSTNAITQVTPTGRFTTIPLPKKDSTGYGIVSGPDGNLWFTEPKGNRIGRLAL